MQPETTILPSRRPCVFFSNSIECPATSAAAASASASAQVHEMGKNIFTHRDAQQHTGGGGRDKPRPVRHSNIFGPLHRSEAGRRYHAKE
jgi:hypothetical protein